MWRQIALAAALGLSVPAAGAEPDLKAALRATARFESLDGALLDAIAPRRPFAISVAIENLAGPEPPAGLEIYGWLRRIGPDDLPCRQAAEAFLRTGALPAGAIFLNDPVIGMVTETAGFVLADPEFSLASANLIAAHRFPSQPADLAADEVGRRFLLPFPEEGLVRAVAAGGGADVVAAGLDRPVAAVGGTDGALWVLGAGGQLTRIAPDGGRVTLAGIFSGMRLGADPAFLSVHGPEASVTLETAGGRERLRLPGPATDSLLLGPAEAAPFALALLGPKGVAIHYLDAPDSPVAVSLPAVATRFAAAPDGRLLAAWSPQGGPVFFVDVVRGRLIQASKAPVPVSEVAFTRRTAALMLADQSRVATLDTASLLRDGAADLRETPIGLPRARLLDHGGLLAPLRPGDGLLAVQAENGQAFRIEEAAALGNAPPMTAAPLRAGGIPVRVAALDRSFREIKPGLLRTAARLPGPGRYELVATAGFGSVSFCAALPVAEPEDPAARRRIVRLAVAAQEAGGLRLAATAPDGRALPNLIGTLTFAALTGAWRAKAAFEADAEGRSHRLYPLPQVGQVVVTLDLDLAQAEPGPPFAVAPLILEANP